MTLEQNCRQWCQDDGHNPDADYAMGHSAVIAGRQVTVAQSIGKVWELYIPQVHAAARRLADIASQEP